jgi:beta-N-acetylhexosaminidase
MVMAGMDGTWPSPELLETIRRGRIGGIILFSSNVTARLSSAIRVMQAAAHAGGNPPLLIAVDQEGGPIKRLEGPPSIAPRSIRDPQTAAAQGEMTARFLRLVGVNVDLAPVADVASSPRSFIAAEERGFAGQSRQVAVLASAFARGLQTGGVAATGKHFPGVGSVEVDTDTLLPTVAAPESQVDDGLVPFQQLISGGVDMIMVASAVYPTLDRSAAPAVFSPAIVNGLLRQQLGFRGVIITDALDTPAQLGGTPGERAVRAITAGADIALLAAPQYGPQAVRSLIDAVQAGVLSRSRLEASYAHVVTLKEHVAAIGARAAATN